MTIKDRVHFMGIFSIYSKGTLIALFAGAGIVFFIVFTCILAPLLSPYDPLNMDEEQLAPPSITHIMGSDTLGRDVFSRTLHGGRASLFIATTAMFFSLSLGVPVGCLSGYKGGKIDQVLVTVMDAMYSFPVYITALTIAALLGSSVENITIAVGLAYVPQYFRLVRSVTLSVKEKEFIEAEKAIGVGTLRMATHYILPYTLSSVIVIATMGVADSIITVSGLGFIGLGLKPPIPEWGTDLRWGRDVFLLGNWWVVFYPGLMIFLSVLGFNLLGEGLNRFFRERTGGRFAA